MAINWNQLDNIYQNSPLGWLWNFGRQFIGPSQNTAENIIADALGSSRSEYISDREHTEAREDSAYQRAVADMQKAGLNPYTLGAGSGSSSSTSSVGENTIASKLQILGYILDLKNLDIKNRQVANQAISTILNGFRK